MIVLRNTKWFWPIKWMTVEEIKKLYPHKEKKNEDDDRNEKDAPQARREGDVP